MKSLSPKYKPTWLTSSKLVVLKNIRSPIVASATLTGTESFACNLDTLLVSTFPFNKAL